MSLSKKDQELFENMLRIQEQTLEILKQVMIWVNSMNDVKITSNPNYVPNYVPIQPYFYPNTTGTVFCNNNQHEQNT